MFVCNFVLTNLKQHLHVGRGSTVSSILKSISKSFKMPFKCLQYTLVHTCVVLIILKLALHWKCLYYSTLILHIDPTIYQDYSTLYSLCLPILNCISVGENVDIYRSMWAKLN